jgi:LuxR family quorum sensing-dependent transcriptional regulator
MGGVLTTAVAGRALQSADVLRIAEAIKAADSVPALRSSFLEALKPFGVAGFTFAAIRQVKSVFLHAEVVRTWPDQAQTSFQKAPNINSDPIILRSRTALETFAWDLSAYDLANPVHATLVALRRSVGSLSGICCPIPYSLPGRSVLYASGPDIDTSPGSMLAMQLLAQHFAVRLNVINAAAHPPDGTTRQGVFVTIELSPRERQVLGWIAFGKSSREAAIIMGISEHTVNDYIASAITKLGASNRTEAVMRAVLTGQIDLT